MDAVATHAALREPSDTANGRLVRWSPVGGLLWLAGTVAAIAVGTGSGDTAAEIVERAEGHQLGIGIWVIVTLLYPLLLGWFVGGLAVRLRTAGAEAESTFALVGGTVFTVLLFVVDVIVFVPLSELSSRDTSVQLEYASVIPVLEDVSWFVLGGAGVAAAAMIVASSLGARRVGLVSGWAFWVSLVLGVVALATIAFVGALAWVLWIGLASFWMLAVAPERPS